MDPILFNRKTDAKVLAAYEKRMTSALDDFETKWLGRGTDFIVGNNVTVADILAACELEQPSKF